MGKLMNGKCGWENGHALRRLTQGDDMLEFSAAWICGGRFF